MKRSIPWAALAVLALAGWFRLHDLSRWPLDGDEVYSLFDVRKVLHGTEWPEGVRSHPIGYLGMAATARILGDSEGSLRLFAALCSLGAVAALLFMRRDVVSRSVALTAGLLAAISPWLIYHGQEARFYGTLLLFAALATLWALPGPGRRPWLSGLMCVLALLSHPSALPLGVCLLLPLLLRPQSRRRLALLLLAALAVLAAWLSFSAGAARETVMAALERRALTNYDALHFVAGLGYNAGPGTLLLAFVGGVLAWRRRDEGDVQLLAAAWLPSAGLLLAAACGVSAQQRYAMASMPALLLLAGQGLLALRSRRVLWTAAAASALLPPLPALFDYTRNGDRSDLRAAAAWLAAHASPRDIIVSDDHALLDVYLDQAPDFSRRASIEAPLDDHRMQMFLRNVRDTWVVLKSSHMQGAYGKEFTDWVKRGFVKRTEIGLPPLPLVRHDNRLFIFERRARMPPR